MTTGGVQFKMQCLKCGKTGPALAHAKMTEEQRRNAPAVDPSIRQAYWQQRQEQRAAEWAEEKASRTGEWWNRYHSYMTSPEWYDRRRRVLLRDNHRCQSCLELPATQVHHLTYRHLGNEPLFELVSVCNDCHERITALDNQGVAL